MVSRSSRSLAAVASLLAAIPFVWLASFAVVYRCDLGHYGRSWSHGDSPGWLTSWELAVTAACALIAGIVVPKVVRLWSRAQPLTRGEWISLVMTLALVAGAVMLAPAAMRDPRAQFDALFNNKHQDICVH